MTKYNKIWQLLIASLSICLLVVLDQLTKHLAVIKLKGNNPFIILKGILEFSYLENTGAAWGILSGGRIILVPFSIIILLAIGFIIYRTPLDKKYLPFRIVMIFLCAGAFGNLIDRVIYRYVIDFIYFKLIDFPVFNVADMYVSVSMILLIILVFFVYKDKDFDFLTIKHLKKDKENNANS